MKVELERKGVAWRGSVRAATAPEVRTTVGRHTVLAPMKRQMSQILRAIDRVDGPSHGGPPCMNIRSVALSHSSTQGHIFDLFCIAELHKPYQNA